jgi:hypothetical protein
MEENNKKWTNFCRKVLESLIIAHLVKKTHKEQRQKNKENRINKKTERKEKSREERNKEFRLLVSISKAIPGELPRSLQSVNCPTDAAVSLKEMLCE